MVSFQIPGLLLMVLLVAYGAYFGWHRGIRSFLTVAMVSALAYLVLVSGGEQILDYMNRLYSRLPKIVVLVMGGDPASVSNFPLIEIPWDIPAVVRGVLFVVAVSVAWFFNKRPAWYADKPMDTLHRQFGLYSGVTTALTWISAATVFWNQSGVVPDQTPEAPQGLMQGLNSFFVNMPDVTQVVPVLILVLLVIIVASIALKMPNLLKPPPPPKK